MASKNTFTSALFAAFETLGKPQPSAASLDIWWGMIEYAGITWDQAQAALAAHMYNPDTGQYPPKPADIIKQIHGTNQDARNELEADAAHEFGRVCDACGRYGRYRNVVFDNWRTMCAIYAVGGWVALCNADQDDVNVMQANFRRAYVGAKKENTPALFSGEHAKDVAAIVMIGDKHKCQEILENGARCLAMTTTDDPARKPELSAPKQVSNLIQLKPSIERV